MDAFASTHVQGEAGRLALPWIGAGRKRDGWASVYPSSLAVPARRGCQRRTDERTTAVSLAACKSDARFAISALGADAGSQYTRSASWLNRTCNSAPDERASRGVGGGASGLGAGSAAACSRLGLRGAAPPRLSSRPSPPGSSMGLAGGASPPPLPPPPLPLPPPHPPGSLALSGRTLASLPRSLGCVSLSGRRLRCTALCVEGTLASGGCGSPAWPSVGCGSLAWPRFWRPARIAVAEARR